MNNPQLNQDLANQLAQYRSQGLDSNGDIPMPSVAPGLRIDGTTGQYQAPQVQAPDPRLQAATALKGGMTTDPIAMLQNQLDPRSENQRLQYGLQFMQPQQSSSSLNALEAKSKMFGSGPISTVADLNANDALVNYQTGQAKTKFAPDHPEELFNHPHFQKLQEIAPDLAEKVYNHLLPGYDYKADLADRTKQRIDAQDFASNAVSGAIKSGSLYQDADSSWYRVITDAMGIQKVQPASATDLQLISKIPDRTMAQYGAIPLTPEQQYAVQYRNRPENANKSHDQITKEVNAELDSKRTAAAIRQQPIAAGLQYGNSTPPSEHGASGSWGDTPVNPLDAKVLAALSGVPDQARKGLDIAAQWNNNAGAKVLNSITGIRNFGRHIGNVGEKLLGGVHQEPYLPYRDTTPIDLGK